MGPKAPKAVAIKRVLLLLEKLEGALLRSVAQLTQALNRLQASRVLATRNDLALVLHQILLLEATGRVLGGSVPNLGLGANSHLRTTHHHCILTIAASRVVTTSVLAVLTSSGIVATVLTSLGHSILRLNKLRVRSAGVLIFLPLRLRHFPPGLTDLARNTHNIALQFGILLQNLRAHFSSKLHIAIRTTLLATLLCALTTFLRCLTSLTTLALTTDRHILNIFKLFLHLRNVITTTVVIRVVRVVIVVIGIIHIVRIGVVVIEVRTSVLVICVVLVVLVVRLLVVLCVFLTTTDNTDFFTGTNRYCSHSTSS